MDICGRDDFFLVFTCFGAEKWTSADMMTLKEPVFFLRSENVVTLAKMSVFYVKTAKVRWRLGASPQTPFASGGWVLHPQIPGCDPRVRCGFAPRV